MAHEPLSPDAIFREWERLLLLEPGHREMREPKVEQVEGWKALPRRTYSGGVWLISAPEAALVASLGISIALRQARYADAIAVAGEYLDHPEASRADEDTQINTNHISVRLASALIMAGRIEEGIDRFASELSGPGLSQAYRKNVVRLEIFAPLRDLGEDEVADRRTCAFTASLIRGLQGQHAKARKATACATNGDLLRLLDSTFD